MKREKDPGGLIFFSLISFHACMQYAERRRLDWGVVAVAAFNLLRLCLDRNALAAIQGSVYWPHIEWPHRIVRNRGRIKSMAAVLCWRLQTSALMCGLSKPSRVALAVILERSVNQKASGRIPHGHGPVAFVRRLLPTCSQRLLLRFHRGYRFEV
ncbi:hypothetical protein V8C43DRAFT_209917 [Trichoderma afarasin]